MDPIFKSFAIGKDLKGAFRKERAEYDFYHSSQPFVGKILKLT